MNETPDTSALRVIELADYRVLAVSGADRIEFLQGQLTQDVAALSPGDGALAGWASAKGRLLAVGQLIATDDAFLWPLPGDIIEGVQRRLGMFRLRAKVDIDVAAADVFGAWGLDAGKDAPGVTSRLVGDATRAYLLGDTAQIRGWCMAGNCEMTSPNDWALADIRAGLPVVVAATSENFTPQMLNLDLLDGISFTKGCYVGQEIVARTQNLGRIKRRMYRFGCDGDSCPQPGDTIHGPDNATGKVVRSAPAGRSSELTAVVAIEHVEGAWFADEARTIELASHDLPYSVSGQ